MVYKYSVVTFSLSLSRYGWFNIHEPRSAGIPSTPIPYEPGVQSWRTERGCNANTETLCDEREKLEATKEFKAIDVGNAASEIVAQKMDDASADPLVNFYLDILLCITVTCRSQEKSIWIWFIQILVLDVRIKER